MSLPLTLDQREFSCRAGPREELVGEIIQKISASLSILGSVYIVADVVRKLRNGKKTDPYQRIILGLSIFDILFSFILFLGTWITPEETGWLMAVGNTSSCTVQGFFHILGWVGEIGYQMALTLNILVLIVFEWNQEKFAKKVEKQLHIIIIALALTMAIIPLFFQSYNPRCGNCTIEVIFDECNSTDDEEELCVVRGNLTVANVLFFIGFSMVFIMLIFGTVAMVWVYVHVRRQETKTKRYNFRGVQRDNHRESKRIRKILLLYTISLYLCWGIFAAMVALESLGSIQIVYGIRVVFKEAFPPLLGFFNMLVYFLPKCLKYQQDHPGTWLMIAYFHVLCPSVNCTYCISKTRSGEKEDAVGASGINFATFNTPNNLPQTSTKNIHKPKVHPNVQEEDVECASEMNSSNALDASGINFATFNTPNNLPQTSTKNIHKPKVHPNVQEEDVECASEMNSSKSKVCNEEPCLVENSEVQQNNQ